jgi:RHS repeat-associated protein
LELPPQTALACNESNPCNPANGNKSQVEIDYQSSAHGGLMFARYYNSKGPYKTGYKMAPGWRHTYSRSIDEEPDRWATVSFASPASQSSFYASASDACISGWDDIKSTVWSGDHASATASFAGGNVCKIENAGSTIAYLPVRSGPGWSGFTPPAAIKTVTRSNGASYHFEFDGAGWINRLNPALRLEQSGSDWIFTDSEDAKETYDSSGKLISITYRNGQTETLVYTLTAAQGGDDDLSTLDEVTGPFGHSLSFSYDASGRLRTITSADGEITYLYDNDKLDTVRYADLSECRYLYEDADLPAHLTGIIDENGDRFATWAYDDAGRAILSEHAGGKEQVQFGYNLNGTTTLNMGSGAVRTYAFSTQQGERRVSSVSGDICSTCPGGQIASRTYDSIGFLDEATDWNGNITKTARNSRGLTETLTEAYGSTEQRVTTITWHSTFRLPTEVSVPNHDIEYVYDPDGNPTSITITDGVDSRAWNLTYNAYGQVLTVNGPRTDLTDVTTFDYYDCTTGAQCGQLASVTNGLGQVTTYDAYDGSGRLTQMTDSNGLQTALTYDSRGRLLTVTQTPTAGGARVTTFAYDDAGQLATAQVPDGLQLTYTYTAAHYLESVTDNLGNSIEYDYDAMGNRKSEDTYDPGSTLARAMDYVYDLNSRLDSISQGVFVTNLDFDDVGNLTNEVNPALDATQHGYDALNRLKQTVDALSGYTDYTYDAQDNITSVTAPNGATTTYEYDNLDNLSKEVSQDRGTTIYTHDAAGNIITATDARGKVTSYTYDALNRLTQIELDNSDTIPFQYDTGPNAIGRLNKITDSSGETTWPYNNFGQVTAKTQTIGTVALTTVYVYDTAGRLTSMTLPSGKVITYGYNDHLPVSVTVDTTTILSGATYEPFGPVNGWTWGNSTSHSRSFDLRGLLSGQSMVTDTRTLTYDSAGRPITLDDARNDLGFGYDALGRLTNFTAAGLAPLPGSQSFTYDENGNRESITENGTPYSYTIVTNSNRLTSTTGPTAKSFAYDPAGDIISDGIHSYGYDDRGRLVNVDSGAVVYQHNGQGQRVKKDDGSNVILFAYDEVGQLIGEYDAAGNAIQETVWFNGAPVAVMVGSNAYYVHTDHLGTPRIITDGNTVIWRWESNPFGTTAAQSDPDGNLTDFTYNLRFPGQYFDSETGLHYNYYRTYDLSTGRYLESDPIGLLGGLNTYGYVYQNPLSYIDPYGLDVLHEAHPVALGMDHSKVTIIPDNQARYANDPRFNNVKDDGRRYATVGAGPEDGNLVSNLNRERDLNLDHNVYSEECPLPNDLDNEDDFIDRLFELERRYRDNIDYELFPNRFSDGNNSNSYVNGLLRAAGVEMPSPPTSPGYDKPVPAEAFE